MGEKLTTAQIEAELKKIDERLCVNTVFLRHKGLFVYLKLEQGNLYCFWKRNLKENSEQVYNGDAKLNDLSVEIHAVMDRWDGVLE